MNTAIALYSAKSILRTKGGIAGPLIFLVMMFAIEGSFWFSLHARGSVADYKLSELLFYAFCALIVSQIVACQGEADSLSDKIELGTLDSYLLRPKNTLMQLYSIQLGMSLGRLTFCLPVILAIGFYYSQIQIATIPAFILSLGLAALINVSLNNLISAATFWFRESYALVIVKETLFWMLSGALIPLDIYPASVRSILQYLPPSYTVYWPVKLLQGYPQVEFILLGQLVTFIVLSLFAYLLFKMGVSRYQAYGS